MPEIIKITVPHHDLHSALARVAPAINSGDHRYFLRGLCLDYQDGSTVAVATDGHRLHHVKLWSAEVTGAQTGYTAILPLDLVTRILSAAPGRDQLDDLVAIEIDGLSVTVTFPDQTLRSRLIDGRFPDWRLVVPDEKVPAFVAFNVTYLEEICRAAKAGGATQVILRGTPPEENDRRRHATDAMAVNDDEHGEYVIMPMQADALTIDQIDGRTNA